MLMSHVYRTDAPKKATNLSINSDLLRQAKALGINLSATLEKRLEELIRREKEKRWLEETAEAVEHNNRLVEERGTFADRTRLF
jgi:antitoxin CcdA